MYYGKTMGNSDDAVTVVMKFISAINAGDSKRLVSLQTEDFTFIDMAGDRFVGRDGWKDYFTDYSDYKIHVQLTLLSGEGVAIVGKTTGSHLDPSIEVLETVLWTAQVRDGLVAEWRIYSDLKDAKAKLGIG